MLLVRCLPKEDTMREFGTGGHDPRQIDLLAALAIVAFIEPSQSVRW